MPPRLNYPYSKKEFDKLGFKMLYALGEPIASDGSIILGKDNARIMAVEENDKYRIVFWY